MDNPMSELIKAGEGMVNANEVVTPEKQVEIDRALELASSKSEADVQAEIALAKETWGANFEQYVKDLVADSKVFLGKNYKKMLVVGAATVVSAAIALSGCIQDPFVGAQENTPAPGGTLAPTSEATQAPTEAPTLSPTQEIVPTETAAPTAEFYGATPIEIKAIGSVLGDPSEMTSQEVSETDGIITEVPAGFIRAELDYIEAHEAELEAELKDVRGSRFFDDSVKVLILEKDFVKPISSFTMYVPEKGVNLVVIGVAIKTADGIKPLHLMIGARADSGEGGISGYGTGININPVLGFMQPEKFNGVAVVYDGGGDIEESDYMKGFRSQEGDDAWSDLKAVKNNGVVSDDLVVTLLPYATR